jgi:hypothetical protein
MDTTLISPEEAVELRQLYADALEASKRAFDALRTTPADHARVAAEIETVREIKRWIREIAST